MSNTKLNVYEKGLQELCEKKELEDSIGNGRRNKNTDIQ